MLTYKKFLNIILLTVFLNFVFMNFSLAAQRKLEVPIPGLNITTLPALPDYIVALYKFALLISGILTFGALIYGGVRYMASAGSPAALADAKDQIFAALLGFIILFSSWLILNTINPELVILGKPGEGAIGPMPVAAEFVVAAYDEFDYGGNSLGIAESIPDLGNFDFDDKISSIKIEDLNYVLVLWEHPNYGGKAQLIDMDVPKLDAHLNNQVTSIALIKKSANSRRATLYNDVDYKAVNPYPEAESFYLSHPNFSELKYDSTSFNDRASSITVEKEVMAILYEHSNYKGNAEMISEDVANLSTRKTEYPPPCGGWPFSPCDWNEGGGITSSIQIVNGVIVLRRPGPATAHEGCPSCIPATCPTTSTTGP